jgi:hypothetical protein
MKTDQQLWQAWADTLQRWGLKDWTAAFLEAAGPFSMLGAQLVYISQPLLKAAWPGDHLDALARLLEDPTQTRSFATFLREVDTQ